jgi:hypothetical protein
MRLIITYSVVNNYSMECYKTPHTCTCIMPASLYTDLFPDHGVDEIIIGAEDDVSILLQTTEGKVRARLYAQAHVGTYKCTWDIAGLVFGPI